MKITAIIATYNRPDALEAILRSLINQRIKPDEVIIADDGSGPETKSVIFKYKEVLPFVVKHVWHKDDGFRLSAIRNKAIQASTGDYLIFSDGDLLFHPQFFNDFIQMITLNTAFIGSRVFLSGNASQRILVGKSAGNIFPVFSASIEKNRLNAMRVPFICRLFAPIRYSDQLRGGLMGIWKSDIRAVNGWNESFTSWGLEDTELVARLLNYGIKVRKLKFAGITYHLWHSVSSRDQLTGNHQLLQNTVENRLTWCSDGLIKGERI